MDSAPKRLGDTLALYGASCSTMEHRAVCHARRRVVMVNVCPRCYHTRATEWCGACHVTTQPFSGRPVAQDGDADELHICCLCGDPSEPGDDWCVSCGIDVELEIDEVCDEPRPESD